MGEDLLIQRLREAIRRRGQLSPQERHDEMVRRGVIDEKGNVLKRAPEPPKRKKKTTKQRAAPEEEGMREDLLIQRVREALRKWAALPVQERFDEMVRRGVIDEQGNVLLRAPEPPKKKKKKRGS